MKKYTIVFIITLVLIGAGLYIKHEIRPRSPEILSELKMTVEGIDQSRFLTDVFYRTNINNRLDDIHGRLVDAYNNENKFDQARQIIEMKLDEHSDRERAFRKKIIKTQLVYAKEATWFSRLAWTCKLAGDMKCSEAASRKSRESSQKMNTAPVL